MKIIKNKRTKWLIIHERYVIKRKLKLRLKKVKISNIKQPSHIIRAPQVMSISKNYTEVAQFFQTLRKKTTELGSGDHLTVDFQTIKTLMPGAALILASELYRWQELNNIMLKPFKPQRWHFETVRLFNEMGLFDLLRTAKKHKVRPNKLPGPQTFFKFLTGSLSEGKLAYRLMENMSPVIKSIYNEQLLYVALSEAMTNVVQHAYNKESDVNHPNLKNRWWLSGSFNNDNRVMTVLLYDHGVGIPKTLPSKPFWSDIENFIKEKNYKLTNKGRLIQAAVEMGRSKTKLKHRGKGFRQILKFSTDSRFGKLYIVSRDGEYLFNEDCDVITRSCPVELGGTFIRWEIKLQEDNNHGKKNIKDCRGIY